MYARVTNIRFPPEMKGEVSSVVQGLAPILKRQQGFEGLRMLTDPSTGEGIIVSFWETEADAEASETTSSYIGQMSMMSSFLHEPLVPKTYGQKTHNLLGLALGLVKRPFDLVFRAVITHSRILPSLVRPCTMKPNQRGSVEA